MANEQLLNELKTEIISILSSDDFQRLIFSGIKIQDDNTWKKIRIEPIIIKKKKCYQFLFYAKKKSLTKNYSKQEIVKCIGDFVDTGYSFVNILLNTKNVSYEIKNNKITKNISEEKTHNCKITEKNEKKVLTPENSYDFLFAFGIINDQKKILQKQHKKYKQINHYLELINIKSDKKEITIVDCGCGNSFLTLAVYTYFNCVLNIPAKLIGVDSNKDLIQKNREFCKKNNFNNVTYVESKIIDYKPNFVPDVVIGLHACNTATDEVIAKAVQWKTKYLFLAPCCHNDLHERIRKSKKQTTLNGITRYGILQKRLFDSVTDSMRCLLLSMRNYDTDIIEFIELENTDRNLLIRAVLNENQKKIDSYKDDYGKLKDTFGATPYLEEILLK